MKIFTEDLFQTTEVEELWAKIIRKNNVNDIGQEYIWTSIWWQHFKDKRVQKSIHVFIDDSEPESSIWPIMLRKQFLFNGLHIVGQIDGMFTDYAIPVCNSSTIFSKELAKVLATINSSKLNWSYLKINLPDWTGFYENFKKTQKASTPGKKLLIATKIFDRYSGITLPESFEKYIDGLGKRTRADIKKYLQIFENEKFGFKLAEGEDLMEVNDSLIKMNKLRWSIFSSDQSENIEFMKELIEAQARISNGKIIFPTLTYDGKIIASVFGYINNNRCFLHTAGVERQKINNLSPGITLYALSIKELIRMKVGILDLSPGIEEYKLRLGGKVETINQLIIFPNALQKIKYQLGASLLQKTKKILPK